MPPDRKRVLVVEDDVKTADIVKAYLEKDGYDVVMAHDGREIYPTPTEFRILAVLVREPGRVFNRTQLVEKALGYDYDGMDRTVDVHILNLRRKIEQDSNHPEYIRTVYGMGYKFGG